VDNELNAILLEIKQIMDVYNESNWMRLVNICLDTVERGDSCADAVKSAYGGMGSFSDYVLPVRYDDRGNFSAQWQRDMSRLDDLRTRLYELAVLSAGDR